MEPNTAVHHAPVNFFVKGAEYISDNFDMDIINTDAPNAFDNIVLGGAQPDMMKDYVEADKSMQEPSQESEGGIMSAIANFFTAKPEEETA